MTCRRYPHATIIGADLSPIQPSWVPSNLRFEIDDLEAQWAYPKDYFDFIHFRSLSGSFSAWDEVLTQAYTHTKPGGYIEFQDYGVDLFHSSGVLATGLPEKESTPFAHYMNLCVEAAALGGRELAVAGTMRERFAAAGFVDIKEKVLIWPVGQWPKDNKLKEIGMFTKVGAVEGLNGFCLGLFTRHLGYTAEEAQRLCEKVKEDVIEGKNKYYFQAWFIHGRKPYDDE